jgi:hypothetical protein
VQGDKAIEASTISVVPAKRRYRKKSIHTSHKYIKFPREIVGLKVQGDKAIEASIISVFSTGHAQLENQISVFSTGHAQLGNQISVFSTGHA